MLTLADIVEALVGVRPPYEGFPISEAAVDSRLAIPASLFVALRGSRHDGHDFVGDAFARGASAALVARPVGACATVLDLRHSAVGRPFPPVKPPVCLLVEDPLKALQQAARFWRRKLPHLRVIGITGSVGKSTTKELTAQVLSRRYRTLKNRGNFNNEIGLPLTLLSLTTGHERAVLEMGFYVPGEIAFLCDLALPQVGVVTNIGTVHAERAGSQAEIARGKAELVEALPPAPEGVAILNYDDPLVRAMAEKTAARVFFYGLSPQADLWADQIEGLGLDGIRLRLHYRGESLVVKVPLLGRHSAHTVLRAAAVGLVEGLDWQEIVEGLRLGHTQLRLVAVRAANGALLLDDTYNASPQSTMAALNLLADLDGRRVAVLGDMLELGQYERIGHERVGRRAAEVASLLVTVGERGKIIAEAALSAGMPREAVFVADDAEQAIAFLRTNLRPDDVVLVKGSRAVHMETIVAALEKNA